jgi:NTE family protein
MATEMHEADAVFQGGGVKGTALVGALLGFADEGWTTWVNVAGTSAGSIVAAFLACGFTPPELQRVLEQTPYPKFEDFGPGGEIIGGGLNLVAHHGLARGKFFHDWLDKELGGKTFADVTAGGKTLKMIAADVTQKDLLVLPEDLAHYLDPKTEKPIDPDTWKIADAVRMSMSIPFFFQPVRLVHAQTGAESTIVDGGMLSNFPVWLFDTEDHDPSRPTFGFRLFGGKSIAPGGGFHEALQRYAWPLSFGWDMFQTATEAWDRRFMSHSTCVRTCAIDAGQVGTVDFNLTPEDQAWLLASGKRAAADFLSHFSLDDYFNTYGRKLAPVAVHA